MTDYGDSAVLSNLEYIGTIEGEGAIGGSNIGSLSVPAGSLAPRDKIYIVFQTEGPPSSGSFSINLTINALTMTLTASLLTNRYLGTGIIEQRYSVNDSASGYIMGSVNTGTAKTVSTIKDFNVANCLTNAGTLQVTCTGDGVANTMLGKFDFFKVKGSNA